MEKYQRDLFPKKIMTVYGQRLDTIQAHQDVRKSKGLIWSTVYRATTYW